MGEIKDTWEKDRSGNSTDMQAVLQIRWLLGFICSNLVELTLLRVIMI